MGVGIGGGHGAVCQAVAVGPGLTSLKRWSALRWDGVCREAVWTCLFPTKFAACSRAEVQAVKGTLLL